MQISNRGMADWMEKFVEGLSKKTNFPADMSKTAEVNINDLPKVVWNDETFRVMFDEEGATVVNEFGNTVTSIKGATTVEEVDQALNSKQVVTSNEAPVVTAEADIFEEELKKVSSYRIEADVINPNDPNNMNQNQNGVNQQQNPNNTNQQPSGQPQDPNQQPQQNGQQPIDQTQQQVDDISNDIDQTTASLDMMEKISSLETIVASLEKIVTALSEQQYAHQPIPEDSLGDSVQQEESQHMEQTMQESQKRFDIEHNTDLTTMEGRISLIDQLMNDIDMGEDLAEDELVELDLPEEVETPTDEQEEPSIEEPVEDTELDKEVEVDTPEVGTNEEVVVETPTDEVVEDKPEETTEPKDDAEDEVEMDETKEEKPEDKKGLGIEKLNSKDMKIFKKHICPACGEVNLFKAASVGSFVGIYCKDCNTEYAVNTNSEEIFIKKA